MNEQCVEFPSSPRGGSDVIKEAKPNPSILLCFELLPFISRLRTLLDQEKKLPRVPSGETVLAITIKQDKGGKVHDINARFHLNL